MQFTKLGDLEIVTRITGPHHHFLGLELSSGRAPGAPVLERVSGGAAEAEVEAFDLRDRLCREVVDGVAEANRDLGTRYRVIRIRYCAADPPIPGVYSRLARALVEHVVQERKSSAAKPTCIEINS